MIDAWGWPQWYVAVMVSISVLLHCWMNGKNKVGKHNGVLGIIMLAWTVFVLYCGGFWG